MKDRRVALATGCTSGLGQQIRLALAKEGARVAGVSQHSKPQAEALVEEWSTLGPRCTAFEADVNGPDEVRRLVGEVMKTYGQIDILVNNARHSCAPASPRPFSASRLSHP